MSKNTTYILTGYYGSGKTEFCVNLAKHIAEKSRGEVTIADLDVVNPYFRSREKVAELADNGITVMGDSLDNNTGQDLPAVSYAFLSRVRDGGNVIIDLAGGENGIKLLPSCYDAISKADAYEFLCVLNLFRKETYTPQKMIDFVRKINGMGKLSITGLVNNGHMLHDTTEEHVLESQKAVLEASGVLGIPFKYTLVKRDIYNKISGEIKSENVLVFDKLIMRESWQ